MFRHPPVLPAVLVAALLLLSPARDTAFAGWGPDPVQVHATANTCPQVAACEDAANGAFVAWEESDGPLRVAHLLPSGELDPSWPPFLVASTMGGGRQALRALPDGAGGAYFTWIANESLFVQRVGAGGEIPAPWPAQGRSLRKPLGRPTVVSDGESGLYVSWLQVRVVQVGSAYVQLPSFFLDRRGPDGLVRAGWPVSGKVVGVDPLEFDCVASCSIAPASGGGLWVVWANTSIWDPGGSGADQLPGAVHLLRLTPAGQPATGWSAQGAAIASYPADAIPAGDKWGWWSLPQASQVAVADDGRGGTYVIDGIGASEWDGSLVFAAKVHRRDESGGAVAGWPAGGLAVGDQWIPADGDHGPDGSVSIQAGGHGDAYAGFASVYYTDSPPHYFFAHVEPGGTQEPSFGGSRPGWETSRAGDGGFVLADFHPDGQYQYADDVAHVSCWRSGGPGYNEVQSGPPITWYGDVGVTGLRDGGAILCWSQSHERFGVFAVRMNRAGLVTDVPQPPPAPAAPHLALRFAPGAGVRASLALAGTGETKLLLADVGGRAVARETFAAPAGTREWTLAGTASLAPGLYFARVTRGIETLTARVVVTR